MTSQDYYKGGKNFPPPPPSDATFGSAPPPYQEYLHPPQEQVHPPQPPPQHDRGYYPPQSNQGPCQNTPNNRYNHGHNYSQPHLPNSYAPTGQPYLQQYPPPNSGYRISPNPYPPPQYSYPPPNSGYRPSRAHSQQPPPRSHSPRPHSHHRHRRHSERRDTKNNETKLSFLGAGAGGLIGDLLLGPGVGTLGGAIIGALSGKNAAKKRDRD